MKKRIISTLLAAAMSLGMMGTTAMAGDTEAASGDLTEMKLSFSTWVGSGMFYIAQEKGFFAENGLDVKINIIDDESTFASLMQSNAIDALGHVIDREVINYSKGVPEKCIMAYDQSAGGDGIIVSEEIKSLEDLKGKTVAVNESATSYFYFLTMLESAGIKEDEVTIKDMDADSAGTSFVNGDVDAAVTWEPWLSNASQREGGHLLYSSADFPNTIVDEITVTDSFLEAHPDAGAGFVKAWNKAVAWYRDGNEEEGNQIMADGLGISIDDFNSQVPGVKWYGKDEMNTFFDESTDDNFYEVADRAVDFWVERGLIDEKYDIKDLITSEYLEK